MFLTIYWKCKCNWGNKWFVKITNSFLQCRKESTRPEDRPTMYYTCFIFWVIFWAIKFLVVEIWGRRYSGQQILRADPLSRIGGIIPIHLLVWAFHPTHKYTPTHTHTHTHMHTHTHTRRRAQIKYNSTYLCTCCICNGTAYDILI